MKTAIILHGALSKEEYYNPEFASPSNAHWLPWLQKQLIVNDILTQVPELPEPYYAEYSKWRSAFEKFDINKDTALVGHSTGAGFILRWLSENNAEVDRVALVAPWLVPDEETKKGFYDFNIDQELPNRAERISVFYSTDDSKGVLDSVKIIRDKVGNVEYQKFTDKGHFVLGSMGTEEFPELRDFILGV